jgi:hypothetical protein
MCRGLSNFDVVADDSALAHRGQPTFALQPAPALRGSHDEREVYQLAAAWKRDL